MVIIVTFTEAYDLTTDSLLAVTVVFLLAFCILDGFHTLLCRHVVGQAYCLHNTVIIGNLSLNINGRPFQIHKFIRLPG